ncbi:MAG: NAD(P)/FAD-dependent oxidoreductase [Planctomycetota bacterium]
MSCDVLVVGGGIAGLACARHLVRDGLDVKLFEADERVGGRLKTDLVDGFRLDRGFQVLITSYPEVRDSLDLDALQLGRFIPGARCRVDGGWRDVRDPWRDPLSIPRSLLRGVGSWSDYAKLATLRRKARAGTLDDLLAAPAKSTAERLREAGFSERMLHTFLEPWLSGIFLESDLATSDRFLFFVLRMFADGHAALPHDGMEAIATQVAAELPPGVVHTRARVRSATPTSVTLENGESMSARAVVVALEGGAAARLQGLAPTPPPRPVRAVYYAAERDPVGAPLLVLDGEGRGPVNHLAVPSTVQPSYAPAGAHLVSATVLAKHADATQADVRAQLATWFGSDVSGWKHLATVDVPVALPAAVDATPRSVETGDGWIVAGDHLGVPSLQTALATARAAAACAKRRVTQTASAA